MKKLIYICFLSCMIQGLNAQTIRYVKANAIGVDDGSNWLNAYTSLEAALVAAQPGDQLWVASGTYKATTAYPNNTFEVQSGVELYGGFVGTETAIGQRNIAANATILSGDALGDDIPGNFNTNRTDNAIHILHTSNGSPTARAIIDGFTFKGGFTLSGANDPAASKRGGGIFVESKTTVRNCTFNDNRAESGSSIMAPGITANGLIVEDCLFEFNDAVLRAAAIYFISLDGVQIKGCTFRNNKTQRGVLYPRTSKNIVINNCTFEGNTNNATDGFASGIFNFQSSYIISNSTFKQNSAGSAVCIYNDQATNTLIKKCIFDGNTATNYGGCGVMSFNSTFNIDSCDFTNNNAPSSAPAIYNGDTTVFVISNSHFEGNTTNYAAAVANYGIGCNGTYDNCLFKGNVATNGGGACSNGFKADVLYKDCEFTSNTAMFGGAIFTQNDTTRLRVEGCLFTDNGAETNGGCIYRNPNIHASIRNSVFSANSADTGGALYIAGDSALVVMNTIFTDNLCFTQGGAVNIANTNSTFVNSLFARNLNLSAGNAGGALLNNASEGVTNTVKMVNCTVADNVAPIGAGLAQWEDDTSNAVLVLQNCLIQNPEGDNYTIEAGAPEVTSLGGNQSSDATLTAALTAAKDLNGATNTFVNPADVDYHLLAGTAAVDGGIAAGAPLKDLEGTLRIGPPDVGAYEWGTTGIFQPEFTVLPLQIAPNPVVESAVITLHNEWSGKAILEVIGANGAVVRSIQVEKPSGEWVYRLQVADLPAGAYRVQLIGASKVFGANMVK